MSGGERRPRSATAPTTRPGAPTSTSLKRVVPAPAAQPAPKMATENTPPPAGNAQQLKRLAPVAEKASAAAALAAQLYSTSKKYVPERLQGSVEAAEVRVWGRWRACRLDQLAVRRHTVHARPPAAASRQRPASRTVKPTRCLPQSRVVGLASPYVPIVLDRTQSALQAVDAKVGAGSCRRSGPPP